MFTAGPKPALCLFIHKSFLSVYEYFYRGLLYFYSVINIVLYLQNWFVGCSMLINSSTLVFRKLVFGLPTILWFTCLGLCSV